VVLGIDSFREPDGRYAVKQYTGRPEATRDTARETLTWAQEAVERGAGEIVLNCMARDGVRDGFDIMHTRSVVDSVSVPVIASGGAGTPEHFRAAFQDAGASGALAATVFHDRIIAIADLKRELESCGIEMRR
jgi:cyclase